MLTDEQRQTRDSWDHATRHHNSHKGDQVAFFMNGGDVLFPDELELLGDIANLKVVHLQCNAGQDTLGLSRRGAQVTGIDFSPEAIRFARELSRGCGIRAEFIEGEVMHWLTHSSPEAWDVVFASYGTIGWLPSTEAWARGVSRVLKPNGRLVLIEFHPLIWSFGKTGELTGDDYFANAPFVAPVQDYVADSGPALGAVGGSDSQNNEHPAVSWQHTLADVVTALSKTDLRIQQLREYPYSNGYRANPTLVRIPERRWAWPEGVARVPLMYGIEAKKPS